MPTQQSFVAAATEKAAADLAKAFVTLPEDKRLWQPAESARSAMDQVAECAILTGYMANLLQTRQWPNGLFDLFFVEKADLVAQGWEEIHPRLVESASRVAAVIVALTKDDLAVEIETPWRTQTVAGLDDLPALEHDLPRRPNQLHRVFAATMTNLLQTSLAVTTANAADDLMEAFVMLSPNKQLLGSSQKARSPLMLMTECVLRVGLTAEALRTRKGRDWQRWPDGPSVWDHFRQEVVSAAALGWEDHLVELLVENAAAASSAIAAVPQEALEGVAEWPWGGTAAITQMMFYPLLDMSGCASQINYIASLLGD